MFGILNGFSLLITDFIFLILWFLIYSSTEVVLLLNRLIKNSEQLDLEIDKREK